MDLETRSKVLAAVKSLFIIVVGGTVVYHFLEGWRWLDSAYFSAMTLTTVGFGDFVPKTDLGKIFTIFYAFLGIAVALYTLSRVGQLYVEHRLETRIISGLNRRGRGALKNKRHRDRF